MIIRGKRYLLLAAVCTVVACSDKTKNSGQGNLSTANLVASSVTTGIEVGQRAPELTVKSADDKDVSLSSLRGKLVLIDFWASWCMPCRMENPNLVQVYKKYKDKSFTRGEGFTIYSVSLDTDRQAWTNGIKNDGLLWESHVSDLQGWNAAPAQLYKVQAIPANFLVDADGVIIARDLRSDALGRMMESLVK